MKGKGAILWMKDKQFYRKEGNTLRILGNAISVAKKLKEKGYILLHIIDEDIETLKNFDIYDKLTYFIHVEVETPCEEETIEKLLKIGVRVVVEKNCPILKKFEEKKRLLVGVGRANTDYVYDVICDDEKSVEEVLAKGKRVLWKGKGEGWKKIADKIFILLESPHI